MAPQFLVIWTVFAVLSIMNCLPLKQKFQSGRNIFRENPKYLEGDIMVPKTNRYSARAAVNNQTRTLWPNGIVPYVIQPGYTQEQIDVIESAMRKLERYVSINNVRCIQFRPRILDEEYYIMIVNGEGCSSYIGRNTGLTLNRTVYLSSSGCLGDSTIIHEFLHTLGVYHEQSRPDRDDYILVNYTNIRPGMESNFDKRNYDIASVMNTPYDYDSLMHYSAYTFSVNGYPTLIARQQGINFGQADNLSQYDIQGIQRLYNCSSTGVTLPPIPTTTTRSYLINTTYVSQINENMPSYSRPNGGTGYYYYYEAITVSVPTANYYKFNSFSGTDMYVCVYSNSFSPDAPLTNLILQDDDGGGSGQFQLTIYLQPYVVYIFVVTTYWDGSTGDYTFLASGPTHVTIQRMENTSSTTSSDTTTMTSTTTTTRSTTESSTVTAGSTIVSNIVVSSRYFSILTANSTIISRPFRSGNFYYEMIEVIPNGPGLYSVASNSSIDTYGYLYNKTLISSNLTANLVTYDDDSGGNAQFLFSSILQQNEPYIVLFTTYGEYATGPFSLIVQGPASVQLRRIFSITNNTMNVSTTSTSTQPTTSTSTQPTTTTSTQPTTSTSTQPTTTKTIANSTNVGCSVTEPGNICPGPVVTIGQVISVNPSNRLFSGGIVKPNNTVFNLHDAASVAGYLHSVTVQYNRTRRPSANASVSIYTIMPILGSYIACNQYLVPRSQISTTQIIQTYNILNNTMPVAIGTHVAIGITDKTASISSTFGGGAVRINVANLTSYILNRSPLFFTLDDEKLGVALNYTLFT